MSMVAQHLIYSYMVYELKIFPRLVGFPYTRDRYKNRVQGLFSLKYGEEISEEDIDAAYGKFSAGWDEQVRFSGNVTIKLRASMNCFAQLNSIASGNWQDFDASDLRQFPSLDLDFLGRRRLILPVHCWETDPSGLHILDDAMSIVRAIALSRPLVSGILRRAGIFTFFPIDLMDLSAEDLELVERLITRLTSFGFTIYCQNWNLSQYLVVSGQCRRVLEWSSPNSERLYVVVPTLPRFELAFPQVFDAIRWPRLSWSSLQGFHVHGNDLIVSLHRHKPTRRIVFDRYNARLSIVSQGIY